MKRLLLFLFAFLVFYAFPGPLPVTGAQTLESGVPLKVSLPPATYRNFSITVPEGAFRLTVVLTEGSGDLDLFLKYGDPLAGASYSELSDDADVVSKGPGANESIQITPDAVVPLRAGIWYAAAANLNDVTTAFTISATVEETAGKHSISTSLSSASATPGVPLTWSLDIIPGTAAKVADLYALVLPPGGPLLFLTQFGLSPDPVPFEMGVTVQRESSLLLSELPLASGFLPGDYYFGVLLTKTLSNPFDPEHWTSDLAVSSCRFSLLSPAQTIFVEGIGHPQHFIKTFRTENGEQRVDETWVYAPQGDAYTFINGIFVEDASVDVQGMGTGQTAYVPEDYTFDTTADQILAKHGQPLQIVDVTLTGGLFDAFTMNRYYVYEGIIFGFDGDRLVAVFAFR